MKNAIAVECLKRLFSKIAVATLIVSLGGCGSNGPAFYPVSGKVLFEIDESPAQFGSVEFRSESKPVVISRGTINRDGSFSISCRGQAGTVAGWHQVTLFQTGADPRISRLKKIKHDHGRDIAKKYLTYRTSDLRVEIKPAPNDVTLMIDDGK